MVRCLCRVGACRCWALAVPRGARGGLFVWLRPPSVGSLAVSHGTRVV